MLVKNLCSHIIKRENEKFSFQSNNQQLLDFLMNKTIVDFTQLKEHLTSFNAYGSGFYLIVSDEKKKGYLLIRDRLGKCPIYYSLTKNELVVSDKLHSILQQTRLVKQFDWKNAFVSHSLNKHSKSTSFFQNVSVLSPANFLIIDNGIDKLEQYWAPKRGIGKFTDHKNLTINELSPLYLDLVKASVDNILENNENILLGLSGGLDSAILAAHLKQRKANLKTFSIASPFFYRNGDSKNALKITDHFQLNNTILTVDSDQFRLSPESWIKMVCQAEHPYFNSIFLLKSLLNDYLNENYSSDFSIVSGFGSDQFNGGNSSGMIHSLSNDNGFDSKGQRYFSALKTLLDNKQYLPNQTNGLGASSRYIKTEYMSGLTESVYCWDNWIDFQAKFISNLDLGLESKVHPNFNLFFPYLSHEIIEFVVNTPPDLIRHLFLNKEILRNSVGNLLPDFLWKKPKEAHRQNFLMESRPILTMFTDNNCAFIEELFDSSHEVVEVDKLKSHLSFMMESNLFYGYEQAILIINCRILEKYLGHPELSSPANHFDQLSILPSTSFTNKERSTLLQDTFEPQKTKNQLTDFSKKLNWAADVKLLYDENSDDLYLVKNMALEYHIESENKELITLLRKVGTPNYLENPINLHEITEDSLNNLNTLLEEKYLEVEEEAALVLQ